MEKWFKKGAYIVIAVSLIVSCITGAFRIQEEKTFRQLQVVIRYTDVIQVAQQKGVPIEDVLREFKEQGATTILVRENTLLPNTSNDFANWKAQGKIKSYEGYELIEMYPEMPQIEGLVQPELNYIWVYQEELYNEMLERIEGQKLGGKEIALGNKTYIEYRGTGSAMSTVGMGFPVGDLTIAANMGFSISPQAKTWVGAEEGYSKTFIESIEAIPNVDVIYFADSEIPGLQKDKDEPIAKEMIELASRYPIGFIEFFSEKQKGLAGLANKASEGGTNYKVRRLHTVTDAEVSKLDPPEIISRYWLAATERNQQALLFKMGNSQDVEGDYDILKENIETFVAKAEKGGYEVVSQIKNYNLPKGNFIKAFLSGLGAIAIFVLFCDLIGLRKIGIILAGLGLVGYAGILKLRPTLGLQLMALFGASIFPSYAVLRALEIKTEGIKEAMILFLQTCLISFGGAITIVGLLSRTPFGLTISLFAGVKLAHLIPIVLVIGGYLYKKYGTSVEFIKEIATHKVTYLALFIMGLIGVVLIIYTTRTGNSGSISSFELAFRSALDRILGVRPRTKEFIIGYPIIIAIFYYGYKEYFLPLLPLAIIGQISLVNTYAHIHTPITISLIRSGYGLVFGIINGLILIYIINKIIKVAKRWQL